MDAFIINTRSLHMTEDDFFYFCQDNDCLKLERTAEGQIIVMEPSGSYTGLLNSEINFLLKQWNYLRNTGYVFDSSTGYTLPNKAVRSPDASWILKERYNALDASDQKKFAHICPDFVIELRSPSDRIEDLKVKMKEWLTNGCRLAWLIDPEDERVYVYRPDKEVDFINGFDNIISGEEVLPGFELALVRLRR